jgi:hypothetical protein
MSAETASALVGAAMVTVTAFPTIAFWLRGTDGQSRFASGASLAARAVADWFSARASSAIAKIPPRWLEAIRIFELRVFALFDRPEN